VKFEPHGLKAMKFKQFSVHRFGVMAMVLNLDDASRKRHLERHESCQIKDPGVESTFSVDRILPSGKSERYHQIVHQSP
jgi:hypothetical protein